jgi:predicted Zn-dependent protease
VTGLCGANCRHSYYPFFEGISENAYNDATRDELANKQVTYNGEKMSQYEATQVQRGIERNIRLYKRQAEALQAGGQDNSAELSAVSGYQAKMRDFIKQTGLKRDPMREVIVKPAGAPPITPANPIPSPAPITPPITPIQPPLDVPAAPTRAPQPAGGKPVSQAFDLKPVRNKDMQKQVGLALSTIDKIHGDGQLPVIPIAPNSTAHSFGAFHLRGLDNPVKISLSRSGDHQALTLLHEIGHFLDNSGFDTVWSSMRPTGQANGIMKAALNSDWFTSLLQRYNEFNRRTVNDAVRIAIDRKYVSYLASSREIFARAYAQYIATKSGDQVLLSQLGKLQNSPFPTQWTDKDFLPIMEEFDQLFTLKGWIQ